MVVSKSKISSKNWFYSTCSELLLAVSNKINSYLEDTLARCLSFKEANSTFLPYQLRVRLDQIFQINNTNTAQIVNV